MLSTPVWATPRLHVRTAWPGAAPAEGKHAPCLTRKEERAANRRRKLCPVTQLCTQRGVPGRLWW